MSEHLCVEREPCSQGKESRPKQYRSDQFVATDDKIWISMADRAEQTQAAYGRQTCHDSQRERGVRDGGESNERVVPPRVLFKKREQTREIRNFIRQTEDTGRQHALRSVKIAIVSQVADGVSDQKNAERDSEQAGGSNIDATNSHV